MCGIAGVLNRNSEPASTVVLKRMTDAIAHRGPDGEGSFVEGNIGLGHRRLSVIDLSAAGHQPMRTADGRFVISYNGEVYNYQEIRLELEALGYRFRSRTDTEVVLNALAQWGAAAIQRFNGFFAFALLDREKRELTLVRDRFGIKPLYYANIGKTVLFASEIKALLAHPACSAALDPQGLVEYLTFQNFLGERTLFEGVRLLPAGSRLAIPLDEGQLRFERYWDFQFEEAASNAQHDDLVRQLDRLFEQAVSRQLVSDVPIGTYLSGGMDSGSITAVAVGQIPHLRSFTVGFDLRSASGLELACDERRAAEHLSYLCGTEHYEMVLKAGDMERAMRDLVWHMEEPRVGQSYPNFYAAKLASKFCTVVLSGSGGDELFAGYPWRYYRTAASTSFDDYIERYYAFWQRLLPAEVAPDIFAPLNGKSGAADSRDLFRNVFIHHAKDLKRPEDYINHSLYFEAKTFLHGLLVIEDKLSMAHSLEARVPFLDNDLVDFAMSLPVRSKLANLGEVMRLNENEPGHKRARYYERTRDGKLILRDAMQRYVPGEVTDAVKQGFSAPDASWFRGESIDYVRRTLMGPDARIFAWLDRDIVHRLIGDHLAGRHNRRLLIWSLLYLENWAAIFLGGGMPSRASSSRLN